MTPFSTHARRLLRVADGIGHCFLPRSSNLTTWVAATGGLPIGLCTFRSCPACANKFPSRMFQKLLCKIFLPPQWGKKDVAIQNGQVKQMEEEFLCPLPCAKVDRLGICHSISLIYIAHVAYNPPKFAAFWPSHYYRRNYLLRVRHWCLSKYVHRVCPSTVWLSSHP